MSSNLNKLGQRVGHIKINLVKSADNALDYAKEAYDAIEELEGELEHAWQNCSIKDEKIDSLEYDYAELEKKLESHWCICPHCGKEHATSGK